MQIENGVLQSFDGLRTCFRRRMEILRDGPIQGDPRSGAEEFAENEVAGSRLGGQADQGSVECASGTGKNVCRLRNVPERDLRLRFCDCILQTN